MWRTFHIYYFLLLNYDINEFLFDKQNSMPGRWIITNLNKISKYQSLHLLLNALNHFLVWCLELVLTASQLNSHESCQCDKIESVPPIIIPAAEYLISLIANIRAGWRADTYAIVQRLTLVLLKLINFSICHSKIKNK